MKEEKIPLNCPIRDKDGICLKDGPYVYHKCIIPTHEDALEVCVDYKLSIKNIIDKMEEKLKFKKDVEPIGLTEDFYYMIHGGGWCAPEKFLEEDDAKKVREAIKIIAQYEKQGIEEGFFEEM